jgi:hypothetical protein
MRGAGEGVVARARAAASHRWPLLRVPARRSRLKGYVAAHDHQPDVAALAPLTGRLADGFAVQLIAHTAQ